MAFGPPTQRGTYIGLMDLGEVSPNVVGGVIGPSGGAPFVVLTDVETVPISATNPLPVTANAESPLPISGRVELFDAISATLTSTGEAPFAVSGRMELYDQPQVRLFETGTAEYTRESPIPISGGVTPNEIFPVRIDAYAAALGEAPLPVSGNLVIVEVPSQSGEAPFPISGRVEFYDLPLPTQSRLYETATAEYTRESPVPVSGMVGLYEVPPVRTVYTESELLPVSGNIVGASNSPLLYNLELNASGVEYSQALASPLYGFDVQASGSYAVRLAFLTGKVGGDLPAGPYLTIKSGQSYGKEFMNAKTGLTLFFATDFNDIIADPLGGEVSRGVEIVAWTE